MRGFLFIIGVALLFVNVVIGLVVRAVAVVSSMRSVKPGGQFAELPASPVVDENVKPLTPVVTKIVGVTFKNEDGRNRQEIVKKCRAGEQLVLVREPANKYSPTPVGVYRQHGQRVGYLSGERAEQIAPRIDAGSRVDAVITEITGGIRGKKYYGVNIEITRYSMKKKR